MGKWVGRRPGIHRQRPVRRRPGHRVAEDERRVDGTELGRGHGGRRAHVAQPARRLRRVGKTAAAARPHGRICRGQGPPERRVRRAQAQLPLLSGRASAQDDHAATRRSRRRYLPRDVFERGI